MLFWRKNRPERDFRAEYRRLRQALAATPIDRAMELADRLLSDTERFDCVLAATPVFSGARVLAPGALRLLTKYERITLVGGESYVCRDEVAQSDIDSRFVRIGGDSEHTDVVVAAGKEPVYELDGLERDDEEVYASGVPSVYHWIIDVDWVLNGGPIPLA